MIERLAFGMREQSGYIVCSCGAWNTRDEWHIVMYKNRCYMCEKGLFMDEKGILTREVTNLVRELDEYEATIALAYIRRLIKSRATV